MTIQQLETELSNIRKLNASNVEINKRANTNAKVVSDTKVAELEETVKEIKYQIKKVKSENMEIEKIISHKQQNYVEAEKKLLSLKSSMFQQEAKKKNGELPTDMEKLQSEYDNLCQRKKKLLELKNSKESDHKVLRENLTEYLHNLQQRFLGFLSTGNLN